jgi:hypothetical protein
MDRRAAGGTRHDDQAETTVGWKVGHNDGSGEDVYSFGDQVDVSEEVALDTMSN